MPDRINATNPACTICAAKTISSEGIICQPWRLGQANRKHQNIIGRNHHSGTTLRPILCPHPDNTVAVSPSPQIILRKLLYK
ncbi:MAG: hypothetical protein AAB625_02445 [Patescibacteria group bacterium]